jgi:hypothetical protein
MCLKPFGIENAHLRSAKPDDSQFGETFEHFGDAGTTDAQHIG